MLERKIQVSGRLMAITSSLEEAAKEIRKDLRDSKSRELNETYRRTWIDAIWIDQNTPAERSNQVKRMRDMYALATKSKYG